MSSPPRLALEEGVTNPATDRLRPGILNVPARASIRDFTRTAVCPHRRDVKSLQHVAIKFVWRWRDRLSR